MKDENLARFVQGKDYFPSTNVAIIRILLDH